ncbi:hypothetical protein [Luteolibacter marinus]|uniref:hypothetical protein n=1 Tax=Luteolibacter marinus TaxID=2776705 RepID=UPI0018684081|nr:hypothetical protein [Luteolibacter marinus]
MSQDPDREPPNNMFDSTLIAMIVSTGLLIAWAYSATRNPSLVTFRSGAVQVSPLLWNED